MKATIHHLNMLETETAKEIIRLLITGTTLTIVQGINLQQEWRGRDITLHLVIVIFILLLVKSMNTAIAEIIPLIESRPHQNEAMITDSHHHMLLRTIESMIVIMTGDLHLPLPVRKGCMSHLPTRGTIHLLRIIGAVHHHLWVRDMSIRQEREKVLKKDQEIICIRHHLSILLYKLIGIQYYFRISSNT